MSKINTESNRSSMCRRAYKKEIGNTTYIVKPIFAKVGPTIGECIMNEILLQMGVKENEKDTHTV